MKVKFKKFKITEEKTNFKFELLKFYPKVVKN